MKKGSEKYNEACIKIFDLLKLLSKGPAKYQDVIDLFSSEDPNSVSVAPVVLNKYLNTLKVFGINVYKEKNHYYLQSSFVTLNMTKNEVRLLKLLKVAGETISNQKQRLLFNRFIEDIECSLTNASREMLTKSDDIKLIERSEYFTKYRDIIDECENFCVENHKIEVCFKQNNKEYKVICNPREVSYLNNKAYLSVFNNLSRQIFDVPVDSIISIKQIPTLFSGPDIGMTVVYKIRNGLAKAYRLKEWETSDGVIDKDGWLTIINSNENFDVLVKRLMRYGANCKVVSPKNFREKMIINIDDTLRNYEE